MADLNITTLIGRLTADPELRKTQTGKSVASFRIASNGFKEGKADFINCVAWEKQAEFIDQYIRKGDRVAITGRIETDDYTDADGKKVYTTKVRVNSIQSLTSHKNDAQAPQESRAGQNVVGEANEDFNTGPLLDISSDDLPF